jgi:hypothetical protein
MFEKLEECLLHIVEVAEIPESLVVDVVTAAAMVLE